MSEEKDQIMQAIVKKLTTRRNMAAFGFALGYGRLQRGEVFTAEETKTVAADLIDKLVQGEYARMILRGDAACDLKDGGLLYVGIKEEDEERYRELFAQATEGLPPDLIDTAEQPQEDQ